MLHLPDELLLLILPYLDPFALEALRCTCARFHSLIDESVWRTSFTARYEIAAQRPIPRISLSWRVESLQRERVFGRLGTPRAAKIIPLSSHVPPLLPGFAYLYDPEKQLFFSLLQLQGGEILELVVLDCQTGKTTHWNESFLFKLRGRRRFNFFKLFERGIIFGFSDGTLDMCTFNPSSQSWSAKTFRVVHDGFIPSIATAANYLVTADNFGCVRIWDTDTVLCIGSYETQYEENVLEAFTDGKRVIVKSYDVPEDGYFAVLDIATMKVTELEAHVSRHWSRFYGTGHVDWQSKTIIYWDWDNLLVSVHFDGSQTVLGDLKEIESHQYRAFAPKGPVRWAAALTHGAKGLIDLFDLEADQPFFRRYKSIFEEREHKLVLNNDEYNGGASVAFAMSKTFIAIGWRDGSVTVQDLLNGEFKGKIVRAMPQGEQTEQGPGRGHGPSAIYLHPFLAKGVLVYLDTFRVVLFDMELDPEDTCDA